MQHLTAGQLALLESALDQRLRQLDRRVTEHHQGASRAEHAHEVLEQDGDDAPQRGAEREIDFAISDLEARELDAVGAALARIARGQYGSCADCAETIPFDRLKAEPWALRCVECETAAEVRRH
jgi:DnaK suppressor protein